MPPCAYAWETIIPAATGVLSPKSHANVARDPSGSREADPSKEIASPANGAVGKIAKAATGGAFTWTSCVVELARPSLSRTVSVTVYNPETGYAWTTAMPESVDSSPKSHVYPTIVPSTSEERDALNVTLVPGETSAALSEKEASGQRNGLTESVSETVAVKSSLSVTVRVTE